MIRWTIKYLFLTRKGDYVFNKKLTFYGKRLGGDIKNFYVSYALYESRFMIVKLLTGKYELIENTFWDGGTADLNYLLENGGTLMTLADVKIYVDVNAPCVLCDIEAKTCTEKARYKLEADSAFNDAPKTRITNLNMGIEYDIMLGKCESCRLLHFAEDGSVLLNVNSDIYSDECICRMVRYLPDRKKLAESSPVDSNQCKNVTHYGMIRVLNEEHIHVMETLSTPVF